MLLENKQNEIKGLNADFSAYDDLVYVVLITNMYIVNLFFLLELRKVLKRESAGIKALKTGKTLCLLIEFQNTKQVCWVELL